MSTKATDNLVPAYVEICGGNHNQPCPAETHGNVSIIEGDNYYVSFDGVTFRAGG